MDGESFRAEAALYGCGGSKGLDDTLTTMARVYTAQQRKSERMGAEFSYRFERWPTSAEPERAALLSAASESCRAQSSYASPPLGGCARITLLDTDPICARA